jgi:sugar lactone lactonase YvrE
MKPGSISKSPLPKSRLFKSILAAPLFATSAWAATASLAEAQQIKAPGYKVEQLVKPSAFHGVHGLAFDTDGKLYAGSVVGESIYRVDVVNGKTEVVVGSPDGMADDLVFLPDGTMVWTSISQNKVRARTGAGPIRVIADLVSVNSINYRKSDGKVFVAQVFGGDGLWEVDPSGAKPPRSILKDIGGLNGFDIGPDGWIYGPLWFKKQVVKINPDTGDLKVVADGFATPAAANFDSKWNLYVLDTALGTVNQVDIKTGTKKVVAKLDTSLDNLAIDAKDRLFVSNMADNGIQEVNVQNGRARPVVKGSLAMPIAISAVADGARDKVYVADIFALRVVDGTTGRVSDIERSHASGVHIEYPVGVSANDKHVVVLSGGNALQFASGDGKFLKEWKSIRASSAVELDDGSLLAAQGSVLMRIGANNESKSIATELGGIQGLAVAGSDAFVVDLAAGQMVRIKLANGDKKVIAKGLKQPVGVAVEKSGKVLTVEFASKRIVSVDPTSGAVTEIAANLPIGIRPNGRFDLGIGLAVGPSGAIYVTSDIENSLYKLTKQ